MLTAEKKVKFKVPYAVQGANYTQQEIETIANLLNSGKTLSCGPQRMLFESEFAHFLGIEPNKVVATSSCTSALEIATYLTDLKKGDNVIVTPQTYQATINSLLSLKEIEVRFADIDPETLCIDPLSIKPLINKNTKAIYVTHYGGLMVNMKQLKKVISNFQVTVIEDCAHAHGSKFLGKYAGSFDNIACYSFQSMKNMSTLGQGGIIILPTESMAKRVRRLVSGEPDAIFKKRSSIGELGPYKVSPDELFTHEKNAFFEDCTEIFRGGTNSILPEPAAAVGRIQLSRLSEFLEKRKYIAETLDTLLEEIPGVKPQLTPKDCVHSHHLYTCFIEAPFNNQLVAKSMIGYGVEIQQRYFPLHLLPEWRNRGGYIGQCPTAEKLWFENQLNLPIYPAMTEEQIEYIATALKKVMEKNE